jgi:hypothetical protein
MKALQPDNARMRCFATVGGRAALRCHPCGLTMVLGEARASAVFTTLRQI